jgi:hypothetical protein
MKTKKMLMAEISDLLKEQDDIYRFEISYKEIMGNHDWIISLHESMLNNSHRTEDPSDWLTAFHSLLWGAVNYELTCEDYPNGMPPLDPRDETVDAYSGGVGRRMEAEADGYSIVRFFSGDGQDFFIVEVPISVAKATWDKVISPPVTPPVELTGPLPKPPLKY